MNKKLIAQLIVIFLITQILGLFVASTLIKEEVQATIVTENKEDPINSLALIAYILVVTAILLVLIKFFKDIGALFKVIESLAVFGTSFIVFSAFTSFLLPVLILSIALVASRWIYSKNVLLRNLASIISIAGAGSLLGVSLNPFPIIIFISLLSLYDLIAVFKTKHMITLAKNLSGKNLAFTVAMPTKEHQFELGTGDLVIPLVFSSSVLSIVKKEILFPNNFIPSTLILLASLIGLIFTVNIASKQVGKPLPALPLQTIAMLIAYGIILLTELI